MNNANIKQEFSKLDIFLQNTDVGIFVAEVNSLEMQAQIIARLEEHFLIETIDFNTIKNAFVGELRLHTNKNKIKVYYNFVYDTLDYDITKTLNLSREVIKENGKVIFLLPSFLVWKIQYEEPNLRDYVISFFDFNKEVDMPFEPIFAIDDHVFKTKNERKSLKQVAPKQDMSDAEDIEGFYQFLDSFDYKKMSKKQVKLLYNMLWTILADIKERKLKTSEEQYLFLEEELCRKMAWTFAKQRLFDEAVEIFDLLEILENGHDKSVTLRLHQHEGRAYCWYHKKDYKSAKSELLLMLNILNEYEMDFSAWKARIYNDYACCLFKENSYEEAVGVLEQSFQILIEAEECNPQRKLRYFYNRMLLEILSKKCIYPYLAKWEEFVNEMETCSNSELFCSKLTTLNAWVIGVIQGKVVEGFELGKKNLIRIRNIFPENDIEIARVHYTIAHICSLMGKEDLYKSHLQKYNNIKTNGL